MQIMNEAGLPPGVLNIVPGPAKIVGETILQDPRVRKIGFTGATEPAGMSWKSRRKRSSA